MHLFSTTLFLSLPPLSLPPDKQSTGYGLAMLLQTAVAANALSSTLRGKEEDSLAAVRRLGLAASALHGLWMAGFLLVRDTLLATYR